MEINYTRENRYLKAQKQVNEIKGFYIHLTVYCLIIPCIIFINLKFVPYFHWFWFSAIGWGFGLVMHALQVFGYSKNWEERKIKEILEKDATNTKWK